MRRSTAIQRAKALLAKRVKQAAVPLLQVSVIHPGDPVPEVDGPHLIIRLGGVPGEESYRSFKF